MSSILDEVIESMIEEKVNHKPYDYLFRRTSESYPKSNHIALELPGKFKRIESPTVFTLNGNSYQQDFVETVVPDGETLKQEVTYNYEHMSYMIHPEKIEVFYQCKISTIRKHDKPCITYMITNKDYKTDEMICKINGEAFSIKIVYISQDMIDEILNTISKKDYSNEEISELDLVRLIHCLIFASKKRARRVINKVIDIYLSVKKIKFKYRLDLILALKTMIKYHIQDIDEVRRLLRMITEVMSDEELERYSSFEARFERYDRRLEEKDKQINQITIEKNKQINQITIEKDRQINQITTEKNKQLKEKDKEIEKLKAQLKVK